LIALNALFGGGMSSRLFQAIREERGLAYTVYSYPMTFTDTGMYSIYAALNAAQVEEVISLAFREIRNLYTDRITEAQLGKAKEQLKSSLILGLESTANRMSTLGRSQLLLGETLSDDEIDRHIDAVTVESVYKMADLIFDLDKASFAAVGNFGDKDFSAMLKKAASS
jgi:predicted Zn-dependent peptidase